MNDMNHHYALHRSSSNDDFELTSATRKSPPEVTVPSQRYYDPTSSLSSTTASSSSISSFTSYPTLPTNTTSYPMSSTYHSTTGQDYYQQTWDDQRHSGFPVSPPPPPPPPPLNQHIIRSHQQRPRWSPESSSHPYQYPYHPTQESPGSESPGARPKERRHRKQPHELLSESQKKANHIASEQKRRQNIRIGFDQLIDIVPTLNHGNRSEALILQKSVDHIRHLISMKNELKNQVRDLQGTLGDTNYEEDSSEDELLYSY
ncbi:hypothetical protein HPULCUR_011782 [Helicostylum pulchrum]|uniref:BHLH domain-containing protein n=1 Tax=Helicostylum pulchrum TaxID=562976 RepID=A0ABP9YH25_9FUNG